MCECSAVSLRGSAAAMSSKLYIGNLAAEVNEAALRQLLQENGVSNVSSVLVKRGGYAFIDCADQSSVDKAIEKLNGTYYTSLHFSPLWTCQALPTTVRISAYCVT